MSPRAYPAGPSLVELAVMVLAGFFHVATELLVSPGAAYVYNVTISGLLLGYLLWRLLSRAGTARAWGFRRDNFAAAFRAQACFAVPAALVVLGWGCGAGRWPPPPTFWMVALAYPLWGLAQQFGLQNLLGRNLAGILPRPVPHALVTAALFSAAHFPNARLMALTFPAGLFFTLVYRRHANIWAVGLLHGMLGALAYYMVLGEDPGAALLNALDVR